jgi:protein O-GlcNAc transferase
MNTARVSRSGLIALFWTIGAVLPTRPALAQKPPVQNDGETRFNMGLLHLREGRTDMAIEEFRRATKENPKNPYFLKGLGQALTQKREYTEAIEAFRKALQLNPYFVDVKNDLGAALLLTGKREEGRRAFLEAFGDPTNPTPEITARNLGEAYLEEKNLPEAVNWFKTATARNKEYSEAYIGLATALIEMGLLEEALVQLETGIHRNPTDPELVLAYGQALYRAGRFSDARIQLQSAAQKDPRGKVGRTATSLLQNFPK